MSDISIFKEMIRSSATVSLERYHGKSKVMLSEPLASYSVTINGMPEEDEIIVIKADSFTAPKDIFANSKHECKRADFVIIAETEKKKIVICIEMKAGKGCAKKEIVQQLKGAKCFISYCREIGQSFWHHKTFLEGYEYRFVSMRNISISKKKTRPSVHSDLHDDPERMKMISGRKILQFNFLID